jgi:hypothetical protein
MTAVIQKGSHGTAGWSGKAMILPGDYAAIDIKTCTLMHELAHRLLSGNALWSYGLGLVSGADVPDPRFTMIEHRHIYLFLYDVIEEAFGAAYAARCAKEETDANSEEYLEAWNWAMSMGYSKRQVAVRRLAAEALPRSRWHERDDVEIPARDVDKWFEDLTR